jgi:hypothetical protein
MTLQQALLLRDFHLKCQYRYTFPVAWNERLMQIEEFINAF